MGEQEPPLQSLLERYQKTNRALEKISAVVPILDRRVEDATGLSGEAYIGIAVRTGRVKQALLERAQPTLLSRRKTLEEGIRPRIEKLEREVAEIRQRVEVGHLPETALINSEGILASLRRDFGSQKSAESPPEETVFRAPAAVQPELPPKQVDTVQLPEWVLEAVSNEGPLIFNGRDLTPDFERAPVALRAMRVLVQTSEKRPVARSALARAVYPDAQDLKVALLRLSVLRSTTLHGKLYELGLRNMPIFPQEGNQTGEVHYYLEERSVDGQGEEEVNPVAQTVFEAAAAPPPPAEAIITEQSEFKLPNDQELFLIACALKSRAFIDTTRGRLTRWEEKRLNRIVKEKKEQVEIPADDLDGLILQTASRLPNYHAQMQKLIARFGKDDDRVFVLAVLFNQLHGGKKAEDLFLEIVDGMRPRQARRDGETVEASQEDFTDEQERVARGLFAIHPDGTKFLSFNEIIRVAYADRLRRIVDPAEVGHRINFLNKVNGDFDKARSAIIEQLQRVKLNSSDVPPRVAKLLSWLREQPEYKNAALDDLILVADRQILFKDFLEKAGFGNVVFSGTAS